MSTTSPAYSKLLTLTGGSRTYTYGSAGRVRTMTDSQGYTLTHDYDNLDRVRVVTYPDVAFEQFEYADPGLIATRDRAGDGLVPVPKRPARRSPPFVGVRDGFVSAS